MKRIITYMMAGVSLLATSSCSDFFRYPYPMIALAPSNTWKTEDDAAKFLTGCYDGWIDEKVSSIGIVPPTSVIVTFCGTITRASVTVRWLPV